MQIMDREVSPRPVARIDAGSLVGARIAGCSILFARDGRRMTQAIAFRSGGDRFLVTDLAEGAWRVMRDGVVLSEGRPVSRDEGALWWSGAPGEYRIEKR